MIKNMYAQGFWDQPTITEQLIPEAPKINVLSKSENINKQEINDILEAFAIKHHKTLGKGNIKTFFKTKGNQGYILCRMKVSTTKINTALTTIGRDEIESLSKALEILKEHTTKQLYLTRKGLKCS